MSGRMIDALAMNTEALESVDEVKKFDRQMLGFDIKPWLLAMRGQTLVMLGRGDEARLYLDRVIEMDATRSMSLITSFPALHMWIGRGLPATCAWLKDTVNGLSRWQ